MKKLLLLAILASAGANAADSGVCQVCPTGFDCSSGTPVLGGSVGQVLVREGSQIVWKNVEDINLRGPQDPTNPAGPQGEAPACPGGDTTVEWGCSGSKTSAPAFSFSASDNYCWCRLIGQGTCVSSWVFRYGGTATYGCIGGNYSSCSSACTDYMSWRSSAVW